MRYTCRFGCPTLFSTRSFASTFGRNSFQRGRTAPHVPLFPQAEQGPAAHAAGFLLSRIANAPTLSATVRASSSTAWLTLVQLVVPRMPARTRGW